MSKSKSKKNQKTEPEEQAQEIVVDVPRETSFIPDEEFSEESKLIEHQPEENSGQAETTIGPEEELIPEGEIQDFKTEIEVNGVKEEVSATVTETREATTIDLEFKPVDETKSAKRQTYQEIMADRARQQKEIILRNVERNKAIQAAREKKFQENVEAKKKR